MKALQLLTSLFQNVVALITGLVLAVIIVLGIPTPIAPSLPFGHLRLTAIPTGLSLYQPGGNHRYIHISAANDMITGTNGTRITLATWKGQPIASAFLTKMTVLVNHMRAFAGAPLLPVTVASVVGDVTYTMDFTNTTNLAITRTLPTPASVPMTLTWGRDDIVFDTQGIVYTETAQPMTNSVEQLLGAKLTLHDPTIRTPIATGSAIFILNPQIPGAIALVKLGGQDVVINKDQKMLEVFQTPEKTNTTIRLKAYSTLDELGVDL